MRISIYRVCRYIAIVCVLGLPSFCFAENYVAPAITLAKRSYVKLNFSGGVGKIKSVETVRGYDNCATSLAATLTACKEGDYVNGAGCVVKVERRDSSVEGFYCVRAITYYSGTSTKKACFQSKSFSNLSQVECPIATEGGTIVPSSSSKSVGTVTMADHSFKSSGAKIAFSATVRVSANKGYALLLPTSAKAVRITACQEDGHGFCQDSDPQQMGVHDNSGKLVSSYVYDYTGRTYYRIAAGDYLDFKVASEYSGLPAAVYRGYVTAVNVVQSFGANDKTVTYRDLLNPSLYTSETAIIGNVEKDDISMASSNAVMGTPCPKEGYDAWKNGS